SIILRLFFFCDTTLTALYTLSLHDALPISGYADRSKFDLPLSDLLFDSSIKVENLAGKFGAWIADTIINDWFGIASCSIIFLFFISGLRMLGARVMPLRRTFLHASLITIWFSVTLGFIF